MPNLLATNGLLIFLDDSELNNGFSEDRSGLLSAIDEEAGPIIASSSLIVNIQAKKNL